MKKLLTALILLLVLGVAGLLAAPQFVDWSRYRGEVAGVLAAATGRTVAIDPAGALDLRLLPRPVLTVERVALSDAAEPAQPLAEAARMELRVAPLALLSGRVQVESLELVEPRLRVVTRADGTTLWPVDPAQGGKVRLDRLRMERGTLAWEDRRDGTVRTLSDLSMTLAGTPAGAFRLEGTAALAGLPVALDATLGPLPATGPAPLRAALTLAGGRSALRFAGIVPRGGQGGGQGRVQGAVEAEGERLEDLEALARAAGWAAPAHRPLALNQPFALRGTLTLENGGAVADGMELRVGETRATGAAELAGGTGRLALAFPLLDLDSWLRPLPAGGEAAPAPQPFVLPADLAADIDLLADQVTLGGQAMRDARLVARLEKGVLTVEGMGAQLPGGGSLAVAGTLRAEEGRAVADADVEAATDDLRGLLGWTGLDTAGIPEERLRRATLKGRVQGHAGDFRIAGMRAELDTTTLTGTLSAALPAAAGARPRIAVRGEIDRLTLDAYLPPALFARDDSGRPAWAAWAASHDLGLEVKAGQLTAAGLPMQDLVLSAALAEGALTLRELRAESVAGLKGRASGRLAALWPLGESSLAVTASAETLAPLFRALEMEPPVAPERLGAVSLDLRLSGDSDRLSVEAQGAFAGGRMQVGGALTALDAAPALDLKLRGTFPEAVNALRLAFPDWRPGAARLGELDAYAELAGPWDRLTVGAIQGLLAGQAVKGEARLDRTGAVPRVAATLRTGEIDLDRLAPDLVGMEEGRPWALGWLSAMETELALEARALTAGGHRLDGARLAWKSGGGALALERLEAGWRGGRLEASGRLVRPGEAPRAEATFRAALSGVGVREVPEGARGLDLSGGTADLTLEGSGAGATPAEIAGAFVGKGAVTLRGTALAGIDLPRLAERLPRAKGRQEATSLLGTSLEGGRTPVERAAAELAVDNGAWTLSSLAAEGPAGSLSGSGTLDLAEGAAELALTLEPDLPEGAPGFTATLSGPLDRPGRTLEAKALLDWVAARAAPPKPPAPTPAPATAEAPKPKAPQPAKAEAPPPPADAVQGILDKLRR